MVARGGEGRAVVDRGAEDLLGKLGTVEDPFIDNLPLLDRWLRSRFLGIWYFGMPMYSQTRDLSGLRGTMYASSSVGSKSLEARYCD